MDRDSIGRVEQGDAGDRADELEGGTAPGSPAGAVISANLAGLNTGISTVATGAPSAGNLGGASSDQAAGIISGREEGAGGMGPMDFDALEQFASRDRQTGDEGVSADQSELEAGEMNG